MPWSRQLSAPITLKDGRTIATLGQAREMFALPPIRRRADTWRYVADLLKHASADRSPLKHEDVERQLLRALRVERLL
jgi:hypothetical protein